MGRRHFKPEQIIHMLREAEIKLAGGKTTGEVCRVLRQPRSTQRRRLIARDDEDALTLAIIDLASEYGRYGYRRITALLRHQGWCVNHKRVERIWRREGLKVPQKQPKRGRLITSAPITALSSRRRRFANGCIDSTCRLCSSSRAAPGRTATTRALTANYATSYSTEKSSTR